MSEEIRFLGDLQRLDLKPGDRLVLSCPGPISVETAARLKTAWEEVIGDLDVKVVVMGDGMKVGIISAEAA